MQGVVKQLLRQFKPGEDRFAGMDVQASPSAGSQPVCSALIAYPTHDRTRPIPGQRRNTCMCMRNNSVCAKGRRFTCVSKDPMTSFSLGTARPRSSAGSLPPDGMQFKDKAVQVRVAEAACAQESEESGCAVLPGAAAYLEAEVVSRLEAGDHWIVYAKVNSGKVAPSPARHSAASLMPQVAAAIYCAGGPGKAGPC